MEQRQIHCIDCGEKTTHRQEYIGYGYYCVCCGNTVTTGQPAPRSAVPVCRHCGTVCYGDCSADYMDVGRMVFVGQDNNGFVWTRILSAAEAGEIEAECNEQPDTDSDND